MEVVISREELIELLQVGGSMAGKSKALYILDNAKLSFANNQVVVSSCDTECQVAKRGHYISCSEDGEFLVNPNDLLKSIKSLKDDEIKFTTNETTLRIKHKKGKMELPILDAKEFVAPKINDATSVFKMNAEKLYNWINVSKDFVCQDTYRPVLNGLYIYTNEDTIGVCATDITKMFTDSYEHDNAHIEKADVIVPNKCFSALQQIINGEEDVEVRISDKDVTFKTSNARLTCLSINGTFPNFRAVIPQNNAIKLNVDKAELKESINRCVMFANKSNSLLQIETKNENLEITAIDIDFSKASTDVVENIEKQGNDIKIGFNGETLSRCLSHIYSEKVYFEMNEPTKPAVIKDTTNKQMVILIMPMLIE